MVDFSVKATDINSQIVPDARPMEPVDRQNEIDALQQIGRGVALGAKTVVTYFQNKDNLAANKRLGDLQVKLLDLSTAEGQGMSAQEVRTRSQLLLKQAIANDPGQADDYQTGYAKWLNATGYDKVTDPKVQQAEFDQQIALDAVKNGFINQADWNDPEKVKAGIDAYNNYQSEVRSMEKTQKQIAIESGKLELSSKERSELKAQREETTLSGLSKVANAALPYWKAQYDDIVSQASKAPDAATKQKIVQEGITRMRNDLLTKKMQLSGDGLALGQDKLDQVWKPIDNMIDLYTQQLDGTIDTDTLNKRTAALQAQSKWMMLNDIGEQGRQFVALSEISKNMADVLGPRFSTTILNLWEKNSQFSDASGRADVSPTARDEGKAPANLFYEKDAKAYLDGMTTAITRVNGGKIDEATTKEIDTQMEGILKGVDVYANQNTSAKQFQPIIDFFSNPAVGTYLSKGGKVPQAVADKARQVIGDGYQQQVVPLLKDEYQQMTHEGFKTAGSSQALDPNSVEPGMVAGKFAFKVKDGVTPTWGQAARLKEINSSAFVKVFNKMIMANSHMQGNTDYQKSFEELAPFVFDAGNNEYKKSDASEKALTELASLKVSQNPDVVQEVLDAGNARMSADGIDTANSRGYEPDINNLNDEVKGKVTELQQAFGKPIPVVSGFRDATRNAKAGGAKHSQHIHGNAVDIDVSDLGRSDRIALIQKAKELGFSGFGIYANSLHLDIGKSRIWGPSYHKDTAPDWAKTALGFVDEN